MLVLPTSPRRLNLQDATSGRLCSKSGLGVASILRTDVKAGFLSRRDNRTEPGVLTPGTDKKRSRPEGGGRTVVLDFCRRSQTKRRSEPLAPLQGASWLGLFLGLKPQEQSYSPFLLRHPALRRTGRDKSSTKSKNRSKTEPDPSPYFRSHIRGRGRHTAARIAPASLPITHPLVHCVAIPCFGIYRQYEVRTG